jgi:hypothetical protein
MIVIELRPPLFPQLANELRHALVIEPDGNPAWQDEDGHPVADDQSARVIHLEPIPPDQLNREWVERLPLFQALQRLIEVLSRH